jgi:exonuclease SbcC
MILKRVRLSNIRSYTKEEIDFSTGTTMLGGDIGCGKTTILLAIEFALFGTKREELSAHALLRNGAKEGSVEICFGLKNKEITLKRSLRRSKSSIQQQSGYIIIDGEKTELTALELKSKVHSLLGYPKNLVRASKDYIYRFTVYTPQEAIKEILMCDREERLNTLRRVFGIDKYKRIKDNRKTLSTDLKLRRRGLEGEFLDLSQIKERVCGLMEDFLDANKEMSHTEKDIGKEKEKLELLEKEIKFNEERARHAIELSEKIRTHESIMKNLKATKESLDDDRKDAEDRIKEQKTELEKLIGRKPEKEYDLLKLEKLIDKKKQELNSYQLEESKILEQIRQNKERNAKIRKEIEDMQLKKLEEEKEIIEKSISEKQDVNAKAKELEEKLLNLRKKLSGYELAKINSEKTIAKLKELNECPTCLQEVSSDYKTNVISREDNTIKEMSRKTTEIKDAIQIAERQLEENKERLEKMIEQEIRRNKIEDQLEQTRKSLAEQESLEKDQKTLKNKLTKTSEELEKLDSLCNKLDRIHKENLDHKNMQEKAEIIRRQIKETEKTAEIVDKRGKETYDELTAKEKEIEKMKSDLSAYSEIEQELLGKKKELERQKEKFDDLKSKHAKLSERLKLMDKELKETSRTIKEKDAKKKQAQKLSRLIEFLDSSFVELVSSIEKRIMAGIYTEFNQLFQDWFNLLVEDEELSVRLDSEFTPTITQNGYEIDYVNLSGGEKTALALAYRLSLNKVINDYMSSINTKDIIILDEPTDGFSYEQLDRIKDVLDELSIAQIIIVSHETKIESMVENVINIRKSNHISRIMR